MLPPRARLWLFPAAAALILHIHSGNSLSDPPSPSGVQNLTPSTFDDAILHSHTPALVEFYAPWCGHCQTLAPVWAELAARFAFAADRVSIAAVDADAHRTLAARFAVRSFPTLKWFDGSGADAAVVDYAGARDLDSLAAFVTEKTGVAVAVPSSALPAKKEPAPAAAAASRVAVLDDRTFEHTVGGERHVLVAFTASWCGHCKALAPTWETLARDFSPEPAVVVAKVEVDGDAGGGGAGGKATAARYAITSYPTLKYFAPNSSEAAPYVGSRSLPDLMRFVNEHAGTHRAPGGGLDHVAGTIARLDRAVAAYYLAQRRPAADDDDRGRALAALAALAQDDPSSLSPTYYYRRVIAKLAADPDFARRELARLQALLDGAGAGKGKAAALAPEKRDQLTVRRNILRSFAEAEEKAEKAAAEKAAAEKAAAEKAAAEKAAAEKAAAEKAAAEKAAATEGGDGEKGKDEL
ncbi:MAG: hypothetical protein M1826_000779 [Phylliscum demangeonii]|nr:MAG: hypothetical protein M1826_000779 [Phylliscum demangeonii]